MADTSVLVNERERIRKISSFLHEAERPMRILRMVSWESTVREEFLRHHATRLPQVKYERFDSTEVRRLLLAAGGLLGNSRVDIWFKKLIHNLELTAAMLEARGTSDFWRFSRDLFGSPTTPLDDEATTPAALAESMIGTLGNMTHMDLGPAQEENHSASEVAAAIAGGCKKLFGDQSPEVVVVQELSANALAGPRRILLRSGAKFTDRDITQLIHHEAFVHVATALNGLQQEDLKILSCSHAGTTRTQEGLAVFAEMINGVMDVVRLKRLSHRILAIKMAEDGADFIQVFQFFKKQEEDEQQAFENTRRVFRGGVITGGAPFTKDCVYLDGLLRVHNFLRIAVLSGRSDLIRLLFCGKLAIDDLGVIAELTQMGICKYPKYLPPWLKDLRFLVSYLAYSTFLYNIDLEKMKEHYEHLLEQSPIIAANSN